MKRRDLIQQAGLALAALAVPVTAGAAVIPKRRFRFRTEEAAKEYLRSEGFVIGNFHESCWLLYGVTNSKYGDGSGQLKDIPFRDPSIYLPFTDIRTANQRYYDRLRRVAISANPVTGWRDIAACYQEYHGPIHVQSMREDKMCPADCRMCQLQMGALAAPANVRVDTSLMGEELRRAHQKRNDPDEPLPDPNAPYGYPIPESLIDPRYRRVEPAG